jgi:hypothetical protein
MVSLQSELCQAMPQTKREELLWGILLIHRKLKHILVPPENLFQSLWGRIFVQNSRDAQKADSNCSKLSISDCIRLQAWSKSGSLF